MKIPIIGLEINRSKGETPESINKLGKDQSSVRIPWSDTASGAGFGDAITDSDRLYAVTREPVAYRATYIVADDVFDKWFTVDDPDTEGGDQEFDDKVQVILRTLEAKSHFQNALALERVYGYSLIIGVFNDVSNVDDYSKPLRIGSELAGIVVYGKPQITSIETDKDVNSLRYGLPEIYYIDRGGNRRVKVHYSRCIRVSTRRNEVSVLDPIWDDLTNLRNIRWGMGQTMYRYGSGFPVITLVGKTLEQIQDYLKAGYFTNLMSRTYLIGNENTTIEFKGVQGAALNPEPYYTPVLENISAGTGIPEAILRGAQAGALTGSEVNEREYFKVISSIQSKTDPFVRQLIDWVLPQSEVKEDDYEINWISGFQPSEKDIAQTELMKEQANQIKLTYKTIDEVRAEMGLEALPNGEGAVIPSQVKQPNPFNEELETGHDRTMNHPTLEATLKSIIEQVHEKTISPDSGQRLGNSVIRTYVDQEVERARQYLSAKLKRAITVLPPEMDIEYKKLYDEYITTLKLLIDEAVKATE